jgi:hypothetical protein
MIIHTDDVDGYTTSHQFGLDIANLFDKEWGIRMCDPSQMLGVRRDRWTDDDGVEHLKLSMPSYVDDLVDREHLMMRENEIRPAVDRHLIR